MMGEKIKAKEMTWKAQSHETSAENHVHEHRESSEAEVAAQAHHHSHGEGHAHETETAHTHAHGHFHSPEEKKRQLNRLARISGHLNHVRLMIENDEDCADVLIQLSAIRSALNGLGKQIINEHITHCIAHAIEEGDQSQIEEFQKAIQKFV